LKYEDRYVKKFLGEIQGGKMMNKKKWIVGLSIAGVMALSGTAFALTSGSVVAQSIGQTLGIAPIIATTTTPSFPNNNPNADTTPWSNGKGGDYGMMSGQGANGNGGGYGMMGGTSNSNNNAIVKDKNSAESDMKASLVNATVDKSTNTIAYTGTDVKIVMLGGPANSDEKFVISGLINPTIRIPQGANITMEIINEDEGMPHGVEITAATPPYAYMSMMQGGIYPGAFIQPISKAASNQYPAGQVSFAASNVGEFYYLCQYPGHAEKGMYGKIIIG